MITFYYKMTDFVGSDDICIICYANLAVMKPSNCSHRSICGQCSDQVAVNAKKNGHILRCCICRVPYTHIEKHRYVQIHQTLVGDALEKDEVVQVKIDDPTKGVDNVPLFLPLRVTTDVVSNRFELTITSPVTGMLSQSMNDDIIHRLELTKTVSVNGILTQSMDYITTDEMKQMVRHIFEKNDLYAYSGRALIGTGVSYGMDIALQGMNGCVNITGVDAISSAIAFSILFTVDVYRWANDEISLEQLCVNTGEHVLGVSAQMGGSLLGAIAGAKLGLLVGAPIGPYCLIPVFLFAILGGFGADLLVRSCYRKITEGYKKNKAKKEILVLETKAALQLGINMTTHTFNDALRIFRRLQEDSHPSHHNNSAESNYKFGSVIANWSVVREHYSRAGKMYGDDGSLEIRIAVYTMSVWDKVSSSWQIKRTWFSEKTNAKINDLPLKTPLLNEQREVVRLRYIYL